MLDEDYEGAAEIERAWREAPETVQMPGGGESLAQMLERVQSALASCGAVPGVITDAGEQMENTAVGAASDIVWITHAGVARCVAWPCSPP